jgi:hypothetical protein
MKMNETGEEEKVLMDGEMCEDEKGVEKNRATRETKNFQEKV